MVINVCCGVTILICKCVWCLFDFDYDDFIIEIWMIGVCGRDGFWCHVYVFEGGGFVCGSGVV